CLFTNEWGGPRPAARLPRPGGHRSRTSSTTIEARSPRIAASAVRCRRLGSGLRRRPARGPEGMGRPEGTELLLLLRIELILDPNEEGEVHLLHLLLDGRHLAQELGYLARVGGERGQDALVGRGAVRLAYPAPGP